MTNLALVVVILAALSYLAFRLAKGRWSLPLQARARDLRIEERLAVDPQRALLVVAHGQRRWLVGMTQYSINTLAEVGPALDFASTLDCVDESQGQVK